MDQSKYAAPAQISPLLTGLVVALASAIGAAIATPSEGREAVIVFVFFNAVIAVLCCAEASVLFAMLRNRRSDRLP
jgi:hypothetical protein